MTRLRPVVLLDTFEASVFLRPDQPDAYASRPGRPGQRDQHYGYDVDRAWWWVQVVQRLKPTPLERLVLEELARHGEITIARDPRAIQTTLQRRRYVQAT